MVRASRTASNSDRAIFFSMYPREVSIAEAEQPEHARLRAVSRLLAAQAAQMAPIQEFRAEVLKGTLLDFAQVEQWIREQAERDGDPSYWLSGIPIPYEQVREQDGTATIDIGTLVLDRRRMNRGLDEELVLEHRYVLFNTPYMVKMQRAVTIGRVLDRLRLLSKELKKTYGWEENQATTFVLTGQIPVASRYLAETDAKRARRPRGMSLKHMELAIFTQEHRGEPLATRMQSWNELHPDWAYANVTHFGGDSLQSVQRLLGHVSKATRSRATGSQANEEEYP
jgi:hypothetical protein